MTLPMMDLSDKHEVTWGALCEKFQRVARLLREACQRQQGQADLDLTLVVAAPIQQQALEDLAHLARVAAEDRLALWRSVHLGGAKIAERCAAQAWAPWTRRRWRENAAAWRALAEAGPPPIQRECYRPGKAL